MRISKRTRNWKLVKDINRMALLHSGRDYIMYHPNWDRPGKQGRDHSWQIMTQGHLCHMQPIYLLFSENYLGFIWLKQNQFLALYLAYSKCSINIYWGNLRSNLVYLLKKRSRGKLRCISQHKLVYQVPSKCPMFLSIIFCFKNSLFNSILSICHSDFFFRFIST